MSHATSSPTDSSVPNAPEHAAAAVRAAFIKFFEDRAHTFVPSSTTCPMNDPSLRDTFANAGMNQYKPIFQGTLPPDSPLAGIKRAVNSQKCIRAGGKHNDLDDVGKDTYHHTFFEMLGNWSFGDYFKAEAIAWSVELLVTVWGIDKDRLYATYFEGDESQGLPADLETRDLWREFLPDDHILPGNMKDNFWEMGDTGPCGPCSEVHYDRIGSEKRGGRNAADLVNMDDPDVLEVWNNVFIQFDRVEDGSLRPLPAKHVDTGMGLERIVSVLQDKRSNYDTDIFMPIFEAIRKITGARAYSGKLGAEDADGVDEAYRVIADHIRTLTIAITDGQMPGNEGRGYVLRRILRRAVRYGRQKLNAPEGFFSALVPTVVRSLGDAFPELKKDPEKIRGIIAEEEESFGRTLDRGTQLFLESLAQTLNGCKVRDNVFDSQPENSKGSLFVEVEVQKPTALVSRSEPTAETRKKWQERQPDPADPDCWSLKLMYIDPKFGRSKRWMETGLDSERGKQILGGLKKQPLIPGDIAFKLYDTFGFPVDLTMIMAEERGLTVDVEGFEKAMAEQKERSRQGGRKDDETKFEMRAEHTAQLANLNVKPTDDHDKFHAREIKATVKAIFNGENFDEHTRATGVARKVGIILDKTNHYAEMGGQVGDHGELTVIHDLGKPGGGHFRVEDTQAFGGYVVHIGHVTKGELRVGESVSCQLEQSRRSRIAANHTTTHLLNLALKDALGDSVDQRGSLVDPDRLRFDFTHNQGVAIDELEHIESLVRRQIDADHAVHAEVVALEPAQKINGLRAVFGETYPDPVRVVSIGAPVSDLLAEPHKEDWAMQSTEFCGGTHLQSTKQAEAFVLTSEEGIAKGTRRISGLTGVAAKSVIEAADVLDREIGALSSLPDSMLAKAVQDAVQKVDQTTLPAVRKAKAREALAGLQERAKAAAKAVAAQKAAEAQQMAQTIATNEAGSPDTMVVATLELGSDRKALESAMKVITAACPNKAVMLFSPDADAGRASVMASVPKPLVGMGFKAGDWVKAVAGIMGGKGGGRPDTAQGSGTDLSKLNDAVTEARHFAARASS